MQGIGLQQHYDFIRDMVKKKTGRAMQEKDVQLKNGKTRKGSSPIRESVVNIKESTTMADLVSYVNDVENRWGIHALQIHIHKDEGYYQNPGDPSSWKPNYHAHIIWDWMDHTIGKSRKLNEKDMSEMQTLVANTLNMERGTSKDETHLDHLERNDYILQKQRNEMEDIAKAKAVAETHTAELTAEREHLEEEVEQAKHRKAEAENDAKAAELFKELANVAEIKLDMPVLKIKSIISTAQSVIDEELAIPIPMMNQREWRTERQKNIKKALTDMQTNLGSAKDKHAKEITNLCRDIFKDYKQKLAKLAKENEALRNEKITLTNENKNLTDKNSSLMKENSKLKGDIAKIDAAAIEELRASKDGEINALKSRLTSEIKRADKAEASLKSLESQWRSIWSYPDMCDCWENIQKREKAKREAKEREVKIMNDRQNNIVMKFVNEGCAAQRDFVLAKGRYKMTDEEALRIYHAVLAILLRDYDEVTKATIGAACKKFLDSCDWSGMTQYNENLHRGWTEQFIDRSGFPKDIEDNFLDFVFEIACSTDNYVSFCGSNGCADQLTNWDGTKKLGLAAPEKKKGGGMSR